MEFCSRAMGAEALGGMHNNPTQTGGGENAEGTLKHYTHTHTHTQVSLSIPN